MSYGNQHFTNSHHVGSNGQQYHQPSGQNRMNVEQNQMHSQFGSNNFGHPYPHAPKSNNPMTQNFHNQSNNQINDNNRLHNQNSHVPSMNTAVPTQYNQGYTPGANHRNHHNNNWSQQTNITGTSETGNYGQRPIQNESTRYLQNQNMNGSQTAHSRNFYGNPSLTQPPITFKQHEPVQQEKGTWIPPLQTTEVQTNQAQQKQAEPNSVAPSDALTRDNKKIDSRPEIQSGQNEIVKVVPLPSNQRQNAQITVSPLPLTANQGAQRVVRPIEMQNVEQQNNAFRTNNWEAQHQATQQALLQPSNVTNANFDRPHSYQSHTIHSGHGAVKPAEPVSCQSAYTTPNPDIQNPQRTIHDNAASNINIGERRTFEQQQAPGGFIVQPVETRRNFTNNRGVDNGQTSSQLFPGTMQQNNSGDRFGTNGVVFPSNQATGPVINPHSHQNINMPGGMPGFPNNDNNWKQPNPQLHQSMANHGFNHTHPYNQQSREHMHNLRQQQHSQNMVMMQKEEQQRNAFNAMNRSNAPINNPTVLDSHLAEERRRRARYEEDLRSIPSEPPMMQVDTNTMNGMTGRANNNQTNWTAHFSQQADRNERSNRFSPYNKDSNSSDNAQRRPSPSLNVVNKGNQQMVAENGQNGQAATSHDHTFSFTQDYLKYLDQQDEERRRQRMLTPVPMNTETQAPMNTETQAPMNTVTQAPKNDDDDEIEVVYEKKNFPLSAELFAQQQQHNAMRAYQNNNVNFNQFPNAMNLNQQALQQPQQPQQMNAGNAYGNVNQVQNPNQNSLIHHQHPNAPQSVVQYIQAVQQQQQQYAMQKVEPALPNLEF